MSKSLSGLFSKTKGIEKASNRSLLQGQIKSLPHDRVKVISLRKVKKWAQQQLSELSGKAKKTFNTACVAYDEVSRTFFYGRNGACNEEGYEKNPILFGDSSHNGLLPKESFNKYPVGNCAEVDAVNQALNAGADINHLHLTVIHATKNQFGRYKESCENCKFAFKGKVKENYSGWIKEE